jgi:serine/threonine protein kinase
MDMEYRYQAAASQSEFVLKVFGIATMDGQKCMVLEYADLGDMSDYLFKKMGRPLMENEAKGIYWRLASGLAYLHRAGLAHRDIKLQNFLVAGAQRLPKIADFGLSVFTDKRDLAAKRNQRCGTPGYMAPEMAKPEVLKDVTKVDVYALGASYRMGLTGEAAPQRFTDTNPKWQALSPQARDLITGMMRPDPDQRPTMQQVLQHPWLRRN